MSQSLHIPLYDSIAPVKEARLEAYKQLFNDRLNVKTIELFNDSAEKGNVMGDQEYHRRVKRLIGRTTTKGQHGGDRKSEIFKGQQL